jgi:hypothetical protein
MSVENLEKHLCKACCGIGTQYSQKSGMREECPMCEGRGYTIRQKENEKIPWSASSLKRMRRLQ